MINPKNIGIAAGIGFVLSFLIGIFSGVGFGLVLLRALICAVIFGAVGAGASILFRKFLSVEQSDTVSDASAEKAPKTGGIVDYTVGDDTLPEDDQGPAFNVANTIPSLKAGITPAQGVAAARAAPASAAQSEPVTAPRPAATAQPESAPTVAKETPVASATASAQSAGGAGFSPVSLVEATTAAPSPQSSASGDVSSGGLDELPDIGGLSFADEKKTNEGEGEDDDVVKDSEFATEDEPAPGRSARSSGGRPATEQNAGVMAQAIRTLLSKN